MIDKQIIVKPDKHKIVRKADKLLNARYSLSSLAIKIITTIISMIDKNDSDFHLYILKVQDFKGGNNGKLGGKEYKEFIDACNELMDKRIEFDDGGKVGFMLTRWIASAEYSAGSGEVEVEISQKLRPLLLQLKEGNYLNYELGNILALKSGYIIRLYELLKHEFNKVVKYKANTTAIIHEVYIDDLREQFKIPNSYFYKDIRINILDKAVEQFDKTDLAIEYVVSRKRGKKVLAVEFTIRKKDTDDYATKRKFVDYMRANYVNIDFVKEVGINDKGYLFDKQTFQQFNKNEADKIWSKLFEMYQNKELFKPDSSLELEDYSDFTVELDEQELQMYLNRSIVYDNTFYDYIEDIKTNKKTKEILVAFTTGMASGGSLKNPKLVLKNINTLNDLIPNFETIKMLQQ